MTAAEPPESDEFGRTDPDTLERERRRRERDEKRAKDAPMQEEPLPPEATEERPAPAAPPGGERAPRRRSRRPARAPFAESIAAARRRLSQRGGSGDGGSGDGGRDAGGGGGRRRGGGPRPRGPRIALLVVGLLVLLFLYLLFQPFHGDGSGDVVVNIPEGASADAIADVLDKRGVISSKALFELRLRLSGKSADIQAGSYTLAKGMSYGGAIDALTGAPTRTLNVTIPEGFSRKQIAPVAAQAGVDGDYLKASESSKVLSPRKYGGKKANSLEGFLFPATYELKPGSDVNALVSQQLIAFKQNLKQVNMKYARKKNLTVYDVLTIASMVEREVQVDKERPLVAAVIYNRLKDGIPLGIDSTVRFVTGNYDQPLKQSELNSGSPYNTRKFAGLPPGPIGNPGLASIKAAANPAKVGYLYFVVKPGTCGEHSFTKTDAQFNKLVEQYNKAREAAGGKSPDTCPE